MIVSKINTPPSSIFLNKMVKNAFKPSEKIIDKEEVRQAVSLAVFSILTLITMSVFLATLLIFNLEINLISDFLKIYLVYSVFILITYSLSRTEYYRYGSYFLIALLESLTIVLYIIGESVFYKFATPALIFITTLLMANILFSFQEILVFTIFNSLTILIGTLVLIQSTNYLGYILTSSTITLAVLALTLIIAFIQHNYLQCLNQTLKELSKAKESTEKAYKVKNEFLAKVSHEIKTPLTVISGIIESFEANVLKISEKHLDMLLHSNRTLLNLVEDLLDLSKFNANKLTLQSHIFNLNDEIAKIINENSIFAQKKNLFLNYNIDHRIPLKIEGDPFRLRQILNNLIQNSIKYTKTGGISLSVSLIDQGPKFVRLNLDIEDSGKGISKADQKHIFDLFYQVENTEGSGLGLSIVREIVKLMRGKISIESDINRGTKVSLSLEFQNPYERLLPNYEEKFKFIDTEEVTTEIKILYADDLEENQEILQLVLNNPKLKFTFVQNGLEAFNYIKNEKFDLILLDLWMPILDGFETLKKIRDWELTNNINPLPIIIVSANDNERDIKRALDSGCTSYLTKPFTKERVIREISYALKSK